MIEMIQSERRCPNCSAPMLTYFDPGMEFNVWLCEPCNLHVQDEID